MGERADISDAGAPCSECGTRTLAELLERVEAPLAGLVCPDCRDALDHDYADEPHTCPICDRVAAERERVRRMVDARAHGGLRSDVFELLGEMDL